MREQGEHVRILMVSNRFPPNVVGGAEILAGDVAAALRQRGHEVDVLTSRDDQNHNGHEQWVARTLRVVDGPRTRSGSPRSSAGRIVALYRQTHSPTAGHKLLQAIARTKPDVLYIWNISGVGLVSVLRVLREVRTPIVFHLHSYWWQYINSPETRFSVTRIAWLKKLIIGPVPPLRFTTLIATSDAVKREYVRSGCPEDRIEVIDNAIDSRFLPQQPALRHGHSRPVLLYAGRLTAEKGVTVALQAVDLLVNRDHRDLELHVYGSGDPDYQAELQQSVRERRLDGVVSFHGLVRQDRLIQAYDGADILLVPSLWEEPFGLVAVEAMARAVPVIASDVGGLSSMFTNGVDGVLVPPGDAEALAAAVTGLLDDPERRRGIGEAAYRAVLARYTLDTCGQRVEQHLTRALEMSVQESRWAG